MSGPFKADGLQIEPGSGQTLTILRDVPTGSLRFVDTVVPSGVNLSDLANFSTITGVLVVGRAGTGAKYTTLQSALNAVSPTSSASAPTVILVMPGVYTENLLVEKDGVSVVALGAVSVVASAASATVTVQESVATVPQSILFHGIRFVNANDGIECALVTGGAASTVGLAGIVFRQCEFAATGVGGYTVRANAVNNVTLLDCISDESAVTASLRVSQCAKATVSGGTHRLMQMDYSTVGVIPSVSGSTYLIDSCRSVGTLLSTLTGAGSLTIQNCVMGNITQNGNRTGLVQFSTVGNVTAGGTTALVIRQSKRGTVAGSGTIDETITSGTVDFVGSLSEAVAFTVPRSNATYTVVLDPGVVAFAGVTGKSSAGFTIEFGSIQTTTVSWSILASA